MTDNRPVIQRLKAGDVFEQKRCFEQQDFDDFARLSGDNNPIHVDSDYATKTPFGANVAHGMLLYSGLRSALLNFFPGARQLEQQLMFPTGTTAGETVCYHFEVMNLNPETGRIRLKVQMIRPDGNPGLEGETLIRLEEQR